MCKVQIRPRGSRQDPVDQTSAASILPNEFDRSSGMASFKDTSVSSYTNLKISRHDYVRLDLAREWLVEFRIRFEVPSLLAAEPYNGRNDPYLTLVLMKNKTA